MIYLDNASTTPMDPRVLDAMLPYLKNCYGNPNSPHDMGEQAKKAVENARGHAASLIGAEPEQIVFFHSATDANRAVFERLDYGRPVTSAAEHASVLEAAHNSMDNDDYDPTIPVTPDGFVAPDAMYHALEERFPSEWGGIDNVASCMLVNNETGAVNDVKALREAAHGYAMWFHTDATAAAGAMRIDVKDIECDFMTFAAHKMHGPKGAAALYRKYPDIGFPYDGTPDVPAIVGFGEACRIQKELLDGSARGEDAAYDTKAEAFLGVLEAELIHQTEGGLVSGYSLNIPWHVLFGDRHFNRILPLRFDRVDAETLVMLCSQRGLMISAGAACSSNEKKPSHVLTAMGLTPDEARSSVRVSFSRLNTPDDCVRGAMILAACVRELRGLGGGE